MSEITMRPEIVSLIHNVELNSPGWRDRVLMRLILASIWLSESPRGSTVEEVQSTIRSNFQIQVDQFKLHTQINILCSSGNLAHTQNNYYKITDNQRYTYEGEILETIQIERAASEEFKTAVIGQGISMDYERAWKLFNDHLLNPLVMNCCLGVYDTLTGTNHALDDTIIASFLHHFPSSFHQSLRGACEAFFHSREAKTRTYLLRLFNSHLAVRALSLSDDVIARLSSSGDGKPSITLFIDTNLLLFMVGLYDSAAPEAGGQPTPKALLELFKTVENYLQITLVALPQTVDEALTFIRAKEDAYKGLNVTANLAGAVLATGIRGLSRRFFLEARKNRDGLSAGDYFTPYRQYLMEYARSKGVEIYKAPTQGYQSKQGYVDDQFSMQKIERMVFGEKARTSEQLDHDLLLWHVAAGQRPAQVAGPLKAGAWIATTDARLMGFDSQKTKAVADSPNSSFPLPVCVHPSVFIQMLPFWLHRSPNLEEALLASLRLPFICRDLDDPAEQTTIRLLRALVKAENPKKISEEAATAVLKNEALRQKISAMNDANAEVKLVREVLHEEITKSRR
jgi:hypothetical protein